MPKVDQSERAGRERLLYCLIGQYKKIHGEWGAGCCNDSLKVRAHSFQKSLPHRKSTGGTEAVLARALVPERSDRGHRVSVKISVDAGISSRIAPRTCFQADDVVWIWKLSETSEIRAALSS
jgi:hypothetical protein